MLSIFVTLDTFQLFRGWAFAVQFEVRHSELVSDVVQSSCNLSSHFAFPVRTGKRGQSLSSVRPLEQLHAD